MVFKSFDRVSYGLIMAEIDAGLRDPSTGQTVEETLKRLDASAEVRRLGDVAASASGPLYSSARSTP